MGARNEAEVIAMLGPALLSAVQYVADKIYEENVEVVNEVVYMAGPGGRRTHDLLVAWKTSSEGGGSHSTGKFEFDPSKMNYHKSGVPGGGGVKEQLIEIVYQGLAGNFGYPPVGPAHASEDPRFSGSYWASPRDAWAVLVHKIGRRKIRSYFQAGMSAAGLKWKSRGGSIGMTVTK